MTIKKDKKQCLMRAILQSGQRDLLPPLQMVLHRLISIIWMWLGVFGKSGGECKKVSDISDALDIPRPGVTHCQGDGDKRLSLQTNF